MTTPLQTRARSMADITADQKAAAILRECASEIDRLIHFETAQRRRCTACDGTGRRYPYALKSTLAYQQRCPSCDGSGAA